MISARIPSLRPSSGFILRGLPIPTSTCLVSSGSTRSIVTRDTVLATSTALVMRTSTMRMRQHRSALSFIPVRTRYTGENMATNFVSASYSEIYDLRTDTQSATILGIHTPRSTNPYQYLSGFFRQYKKYRYKGCKVTFIPVSTLPADPLQVSYKAGEPTIDPRDMVNPVLVKGCHGESLGQIIDQAMNFSDYRGPSIDVDKFEAQSDYEMLYYQLLSDPSWGKAHVQEGFKKSFYPLTYRVASLRQMMPTVPIADLDAFNKGGFPTMGTVTTINQTGTVLNSISGQVNPVPVGATGNTNADLQPMGQEFFSNGLARLGWMDTLQNLQSAGVVSAEGDFANIAARATGQKVAVLPKIFMGIVILPPAYKTEFYFRVVLKHFFEFKDFHCAPVLVENGIAYAQGLAQTNPYVDPTDIQPTTAAASEASIEAFGADVKLTTDGVA
uniref:Capsid protein n=1 Tax=Smacoviridae sp. TaxID=2715094 RepID=A0A6M3YPF2_9VIRU|nr:MAG: capsid protein [Smacoviridae sp.]